MEVAPTDREILPHQGLRATRKKERIEEMGRGGLATDD